MTAYSSPIGFMQGRLCEQVDGRIQAFPWQHWRAEFAAAEALGICLMEWTLDYARFEDNPVMTEAGRLEIAQLSSQHGVVVGSLTGDMFMQAPFWKVDGSMRAQRLREFDSVVAACAAAGITYVVVPLVDNGSMCVRAEEDLVVAEMCARASDLRRLQVCVVFECDYPPGELARFIERLPSDTFGINYDLGNSAALDYDCGAEIAAYGSRIANVHIKDRVKGGSTVPLGTGNADLPRALRLLVADGYQGAYILQTARAVDGDHAGALSRYRDDVKRWLERSS